MTRSKKNAAQIAAAALGLAWLVLFFSGKGLLVWTDAPDGDAKLGSLHCTYFTGGGVTERKFLYSEGSMLGRDTCPRWVDLGS